MALNYPELIEDRKIFNNTLEKIMDSNLIIKSSQELINTLAKDLKDAYASDPASVKKLAKLLAAQSTGSLMEEVAELVNTFETITNKEEA